MKGISRDSEKPEEPWERCLVKEMFGIVRLEKEKSQK